jgi:hypothetical protein
MPITTVQQVADPEYTLYSHPVCPRDVPFLLIVLSGWGEGREDEFNAIYKSNCLTIRTLRNIFPWRWRTLKAHGEWVGLPKNTDTGNGEAGNNALGCGKIVIQRSASSHHSSPPVSGQRLIFGHNRSTPQCFQVQPVPSWTSSVFLGKMGGIFYKFL